MVAICICVFVHSFVHGFMCSWIHGFIRSWIHSFMDSFVHGFMDSCIHSFMHSWIHGLKCRRNYSSIYLQSPFVLTLWRKKTYRYATFLLHLSMHITIYSFQSKEKIRIMALCAFPLLTVLPSYCYIVYIYLLYPMQIQLLHTWRLVDKNCVAKVHHMPSALQGQSLMVHRQNLHLGLHWGCILPWNLVWQVHETFWGNKILSSPK